jgi:hypothetical protein
MIEATTCREVTPWRKRFRGAKRYYRKLQRDAAKFSLDLSDSSWFDLWHHHFDLTDHHSRRGPRHRLQHLRALFTAFERALSQAACADRPVQVFISIAPENESEQDALYVHTPNPNGTPFPYTFDDVGWTAPAPALLRPFVADKEWDVGARIWEEQVWWMVKPVA